MNWFYTFWIHHSIATNCQFLLQVDWVNRQRIIHKNEKWEEQRLPGLDLTPKQLFWITYGQFTCARFRDDALIEYLKTDVHSPGEFRLKGPLMNNKDFANDFGCQLGSPMNPLTKISVW